MKTKGVLCKVVCISNFFDTKIITDDKLTYNLTINKTYDVYEKRYTGDTLIAYTILNDVDEVCIYNKYLFKPLDEIRDEKLKELGI